MGDAVEWSLSNSAADLFSLRPPSYLLRPPLRTSGGQKDPIGRRSQLSSVGSGAHVGWFWLPVGSGQVGDSSASDRSTLVMVSPRPSELSDAKLSLGRSVTPRTLLSCAIGAFKFPWVMSAIIESRSTLPALETMSTLSAKQT